MRGDAETAVTFQVLGPLVVTVGGVPVHVGGGKQQVVLAALLVDAGHVVSAESLISWVWGDADHDPRRASTLQVYISNLRRVLAPAAEALGRPIIATQRPGYLADVPDGALDLSAFATHRIDGERALQTGDVDAAVGHLRAGLALWRGDVLAGLPVEGPGPAALTRLDAARTAVLERIAEAELALGHHHSVLPELQAWVHAHPLHEGLRGHLMLALYRCGRQADALDRFQEGRRVLVEELGIEPSPQLRSLEDRILAQDATLDWKTGPSTSLTTETVRRSDNPDRSGALVVDGVTFALDRPVTTLGRHPDRHIVIRDALASRHHADVTFGTGDGYVVVDRGSANGTTVNGTTIDTQVLRDGDVIGIGDTTISFHDPS